MNFILKFYITHRMKKNLQKSAILFGTKSNAYLQINHSIFSYFWLFLAIFAYFCLFLPICESVANLHESTLLFAPNIHAYFCLFFVIRPVVIPFNHIIICELLKR